jgi:hypothetical protein
MSKPPSERPRKVMYTGFALPDLGGAVNGDRDLGRIREGAHKVVSQQPSYVAR